MLLGQLRWGNEVWMVIILLPTEAVIGSKKLARSPLGHGGSHYT